MLIELMIVVTIILVLMSWLKPEIKFANVMRPDMCLNNGGYKNLLRFGCVLGDLSKLPYSRGLLKKYFPVASRNQLKSIVINMLD